MLIPLSLSLFLPSQRRFPIPDMFARPSLLGRASAAAHVVAPGLVVKGQGQGGDAESRRKE